MVIKIVTYTLKKYIILHFTLQLLHYEAFITQCIHKTKQINKDKNLGYKIEITRRQS